MRSFPTYDATHPIEIPVSVRKIHHSSSKGLQRYELISVHGFERASEENLPSLLIVEASEEVNGRESKEEKH